MIRVATLAVTLALTAPAARAGGYSVPVVEIVYPATVAQIPGVTTVGAAPGWWIAGGIAGFGLLCWFDILPPCRDGNARPSGGFEDPGLTPDPDTPSAVFLPATGGMLAAALGVIGLMRRKRSPARLSPDELIDIRSGRADALNGRP